MEMPIEKRIEMMKQMFQFIPHSAALNMEFEEITQEYCIGSIPWDEKLVGNPVTGVLHGGAVTTLIDSVCGLSVFAAMETLAQIATLDLRVDYLRTAEKGKTLYARAECYKMTQKVAFTRAVAYTDDINDPVAMSNGAFMVTNRGNMAEKMKLMQTEGKS